MSYCSLLWYSKVEYSHRDVADTTTIVSAVLIFGNTRHTADQPYNFGNGSSYDGLFPREDAAMLTALDKYTPVLRDWCLEVSRRLCPQTSHSTY